MTEPRPFRYDDAHRLFDESLKEIGVAKVAAPDYVPAAGGLRRIAEGKTALAAVGPDAAHAAAAAPSEMQKEEMKQKLRQLLNKNQQKIAQFCKEAADGVDNAYAGGFVPPGAMTSGNGAGPTGPGERASSTPKEGIHQGPAADLIARTLREHREEEAKGGNTIGG